MNKIVGAHNTMTGLFPKNYMAKYFGMFCQCQNKNLRQLSRAGITCFDLRFWYDEYGKEHYGHGQAEYEYIYTDLLDIVNDIQNYHKEFNNDELLYIRLILEHPKNNGRTKFIKNCERLEKCFPDIIFFEGRDKHTWEKLYTFNQEDKLPPVYEYHASVSGKGLYKVLPYMFYKKYGKDYELQEGINLIDFV